MRNCPHYLEIKRNKTLQGDFQAIRVKGVEVYVTIK